jgi:hypothetical protein
VRSSGCRKGDLRRPITRVADVTPRSVEHLPSSQVDSWFVRTTSVSQLPRPTRLGGQRHALDGVAQLAQRLVLFA